MAEYKEGEITNISPRLKGFLSQHPPNGRALTVTAQNDVEGLYQFKYRLPDDGRVRGPEFVDLKLSPEEQEVKRREWEHFNDNVYIQMKGEVDRSVRWDNGSLNFWIEANNNRMRLNYTDVEFYDDVEDAQEWYDLSEKHLSLDLYLGKKKFQYISLDLENMTVGFRNIDIGKPGDGTKDGRTEINFGQPLFLGGGYTCQFSLEQSDSLNEVVLASFSTEGQDARVKPVVQLRIDSDDGKVLFFIFNQDVSETLKEMIKSEGNEWMDLDRYFPITYREQIPRPQK